MIHNHNVYIIAAVDEEFGIGKNDDLAWNFKADMRHFTNTTKETHDHVLMNAVIMGRTTWESLPEKFRPLPDRYNVILTSDLNFKAQGADVVGSLEDALTAADNDDIENIFIIGGARVYGEAIQHPAVDGIYLTHIAGTYDCDVFFPVIPDEFSDVETLGNDNENGVHLEFALYKKERGEDEDEESDEDDFDGLE